MIVQNTSQVSPDTRVAASVTDEGNIDGNSTWTLCAHSIIMELRHVKNRITNYLVAFSLDRKENLKLTNKNSVRASKEIVFYRKAQVWDIKITDGSFPVMNFQSEVTVLKPVLCTLYLLLNWSFHCWGGLDAKDVTNLSETSWGNHRFLFCTQANSASVIVVSGQVLACDRHAKVLQLEGIASHLQDILDNANLNSVL